MVRRSTRKRLSDVENIREEEDDDFVPIKSIRRSSSVSQSESESLIEPGFKNKLKALLQDNSKTKWIENRNILTTINNAQNGWLRHRVSESIEEKARTNVVESLRNFGVYKTSSPFDKRITAITWHPTQSNLLAVGNKWGSIVLWNYERDTFNRFVDVVGPGNSIQNIKIHPSQPEWVYTCSIDGTMALKNLEEGSNIKVFQSYDSYHFWYTAFDISFQNKLLVCGNNKGTMTLMTSEGKDTVWSKKLHKGKIHDIRFSPRVPWLLVSTSVDHSVKIWDVRNVKEKEPLADIPHNTAVNSAVFSSVDGARILTTDQHSELRVYKGPQWSCQNIIYHPHRQFQHLSPIIATWHPLVDLIVVGRYPDPKFEGYVEGEARSIDLIDPDKGTLEYKMTTPYDNRIPSLNQFNSTGEALLSCAHGTLNIWKSSLNRTTAEEDAKEDVSPPGNEGFRIDTWPDLSKSDSKSTKTKSKKAPSKKIRG